MMEGSLILAGAASVIATVAYTTFMWAFLRRRIVERGGIFRKAKELFFEELHRRITLDVIQDLDDVTMVKNWVMGQEESSRFEGMPVDKLLEEFLSSITQSSEDKGYVKQAYIFVETLIDAKRAQEPFSILPSEERTKAQRLQRSIESGHKEDAMSQLQELANSLGGRLEELATATTRNRNLAIAAVIASISAIPFAVAF